MSANSDGIRSKIMSAYYEDAKVADDDMLLLSKVWKASGWERDRSLLENLRAMPSPETIRRTRQKLVADGAIQPSVSATERRYKHFKRVRRELGYEL